VSPAFCRSLDIFSFHWAGLVQFHHRCGAIDDTGSGPDCVDRGSLGSEMLKVTASRFSQWSIFVTSDGAWTAVKSVEHRKPPLRERLCFSPVLCPVRWLLKRVKSHGFKTAQSIAERQSGFGVGHQATFSASTEQPWQHAKISYPEWYGDYGGTATIDFYLRDASRYRLVIVLMGWGAEGEASSILNSVTIPSA